MDELARPIDPQALLSIPVFNPKEDNPRQWLNTVDRLADVYGWSASQRVTAAKCRLSAAAQVWEDGMSAATPSGIKFKVALLERFAISEDELLQQLATCRQGKLESVRAYADRFRHLLYQLGLLDADADRLAVKTNKNVFLRGLNPKVRDRVFLFEPPDLEAAIRKAIYVAECPYDDATDDSGTDMRVPPPDHRRQRDQSVSPRTPRQHWQPDRCGEHTGPPAPGPALDDDELEDIGHKLAQMAIKYMQSYATVNYTNPAYEYESASDMYMMERMPSSYSPWRAEDILDDGYAGTVAPAMSKRAHAPEPPYQATKRVARDPARDAPMEADLPQRRAGTLGNVPAPPAVPRRMTSRAEDTLRAPRAAPHEELISVPPGTIEPEAKLADEVVARVMKTPVSLGQTLRINSVHVLNHAASKLVNLARAAAVSQAAAGPPPTSNPPRMANLYDNGDVTVGPELVISQSAFKPKFADPDAAPAAQHGAAPAALHTSEANTPYPAFVPKYQVCKAQVRLRDSEGFPMAFTAVIDSGACHSVVTLNTLRRLGLQDEIEPTDAVFLNANGARSQAFGVIRDLPITLKGCTFPLDMIVTTAHSYSLLLGSDWLTPLGATLCFKTKSLTYSTDTGGRSSVPISFLRSAVQPGLAAMLTSDVPDPHEPIRVDKKGVRTSRANLPTPMKLHTKVQRTLAPVPRPPEKYPFASQTALPHRKAEGGARPPPPCEGDLKLGRKPPRACAIAEGGDQEGTGISAAPSFPASQTASKQPRVHKGRKPASMPVTHRMQPPAHDAGHARMHRATPGRPSSVPPRASARSPHAPPSSARRATSKRYKGGVMPLSAPGGSR